MEHGILVPGNPVGGGRIKKNRRATEKTQQALLADFDKVEEERVGHGKHEEFHRLMDHLRGIYIT